MSDRNEAEGSEGDGAARMAPSGAAEVRTLSFADDGTVPNHPDLPVVLMRGALAPGASADAIAALIERNGWGGTWRWRVFDYHHYHPDGHEVLAVASGWAELMLGGPEGERVRVEAGDVLVLPTGTGHRQLEAGAGFEVVGAYPPGQEDVETVRAERPHAPGTPAQIIAVPMPTTDPIHGASGPLVAAWSA